MSKRRVDADAAAAAAAASSAATPSAVGAARSSSGSGGSSGSGAYVPVHKRQSTDPSIAIRRSIRGLLNRLAPQTLVATVAGLSEVLEKNSKRLVSECLFAEIREAALRVPRNPLVPLYAAAVAMLTARAGDDIAWRVLEDIAVGFDRFYRESTAAEEVAGGAGGATDGESTGANDAAMNFAAFLAYMYLFQVISHEFLFELLDRLASRLGERDIDLTMTIVRLAGSSLRSDDPARLKKFFQACQAHAVATSSAGTAAAPAPAAAAAAAATAGAAPTRARLMLEVLLDLKNNKKTFAASGSDFDSIAGAVKHARTKSDKSLTRLQVSWSDLLEAERRGRWWLVGAAWSGRDESAGAAALPAGTAAAAASSAAAGVDSEGVSLEALAREQKMNTPLRRQVFATMMTSEDYLDAFEKLLKLGLSTTQEREIVFVLMDACGQESTYNPFYGLLAKRLCEFHRRFAFTLQLRFWDYIKSFAAAPTPVRKIAHLARLLAYLLANFVLSPALFKAVPLEAPMQRQLLFLRLVFVHLLCDFDEKSALGVFQRMTSVRDLDMLRDSMSIFFDMHLPRRKLESVPIPMADERRALLAERLARVRAVLKSAAGV